MEYAFIPEGNTCIGYRFLIKSIYEEGGGAMGDKFILRLHLISCGDISFKLNDFFNVVDRITSIVENFRELHEISLIIGSFGEISPSATNMIKCLHKENLARASKSGKILI